MPLCSQAGGRWDPAWRLCCKNVEQKSKQQLTLQVKYKISVESSPFGSFITIRFTVPSGVNSRPEIPVRSGDKQWSWRASHCQWNFRKLDIEIMSRVVSVSQKQEVFKMQSGRSLSLPSALDAFFHATPYQRCFFIPLYMKQSTVSLQTHLSWGAFQQQSIKQRGFRKENNICWASKEICHLLH